MQVFQVSKKTYLKNYKLSFCWNGSPVKLEGKANVVKKTGAKIPGGLWKISSRDEKEDSDEKELDDYEGYPTLYAKDFFKFNGEKIMFYIMKRQHSFKPPLRQYVDIINQGYKDCNLDREYLKKRLTHYNIEL